MPGRFYVVCASPPAGDRRPARPRIISNGMPSPACWTSIGPQRVDTTTLPCAARSAARVRWLRPGGRSGSASGRSVRRRAPAPSSMRARLRSRAAPPTTDRTCGDPPPNAPAAGSIHCSLAPRPSAQPRMRPQSRLSPTGDLATVTASRSKNDSVARSTLPAKKASSRGAISARTAWL